MYRTSLQFGAPVQSMGERSTIDKFQLTAYRNTVGNARCADALFLRDLRDVVRCGISLYSSASGEYDLIDFTFTKTRLQAVKLKLLRPYTVQR